MGHGKSRDIAAPAERVWAIWSDTSTWPTWNLDIQSVKLSGTLTSGVTGEMTTNSGGHHHIQIAEVQPGRAFTVISDGLPASKLHFRCEVREAGAGSVASQEVAIHGLMAIMSWMMGPQIAKTFDPVLAGLAKASEAS